METKKAIVAKIEEVSWIEKLAIFVACYLVAAWVAEALISVIERAQVIQILDEESGDE